MAQIEEGLQPYVSEGDMMALFLNGELRGLASPAITVNNDQTSSVTFLMKAYGNESGSEPMHISLQYYNQRLKHIFTLSDDIILSSDESIGIDDDYIPDFTYGSAKYPIVKTVNVESLLTKAGVTPTTGVLVGAFVGTECRGKVTLSASGVTLLTIYGRNAGESVTLKCYDATTERLFTIADVMKM